MKHRVMRLFSGARLCIPVQVRYAADTTLITVTAGRWRVDPNNIAPTKRKEEHASYSRASGRHLPAYPNERKHKIEEKSRDAI